ncbi:DUF3857 domain-containing protein [Sphingomonas sp. ID0503]|uniref:DUF3857 domain-containing protein n=1 Tax=Sphingomonas sp. ID0503 TaxID=3399691 RepID=UPI003AFA5349
MRVMMFLIGAAIWAGAASAEDKPLIGPPSGWVAPRAVPAVQGPPGEAPISIVMQDQQVALTPEGVEAYNQNVARVQTPDGLAAMGTLQIAWKPETDRVTVHKLHILRDGKVIDVLAGGQTFTVLRRESNLERATLDGILTATIQPEGLQVGDVIDMAFTIRRQDPLFQGVPETSSEVQTVLPSGLVTQSVRWPASLPVRWRSTDPAVTPFVEKKAGGERIASLTMRDVAPAVQPKFAPFRFAELRQTDFTTYASWAEVAARLAPLYAKTAVIAGEPLKAELATIKAAGGGKKGQAEAALRLVEDRVRYVMLGMGDGSMVPAAADLTWSRRFGDCKGKTVLLIALLREIGIEAVPVAVNAGGGDGIDKRLPMVGLFNHVIVRAEIDGKTYWLDGTRIGDRKLDQIETPDFIWGLPLVEKGATLVPILASPRAQPDAERSIEMDASRGLFLPVPFKATQVFRGDGAVDMKTRLSGLTATDLDRGLRDYWRGQYDFLTVKTVSARYDEESRTETLSVEGTAEMEWKDGWYEADGMHLGWKADFTRAEGPNKDAPFKVDFPDWGVTRERIVLPNKGRGFTVKDVSVDQTVGAIAFRRAAAIKDGVFVAEASSRSLAREFPASEAAAVQKTLRAMNDVRVWLKAPADYKANAAEVAQLAAGATTEVERLLIQAGALLDDAKFAEALPLLDKAAKAEPKNVEVLSRRAAALEALGKRNLAKADMDAGLAIEPANFALLKMRIPIALEEENRELANLYIAGAVREKPEDPGILMLRAALRWEVRDAAGALEDAEHVIRLNPNSGEAYLMKANACRRLKKADCVAEAAKAALEVPEEEDSYSIAAGAAIYRSIDRELAIKALTDLIARKPSGTAYQQRALLRPESQRAERRADLDAAVRIAPADEDIALARAQLAREERDYATALRLLDRQGESAPGTDILNERGIVRALSGDAARAAIDFKAARARARGAQALNELCWAKAIAGAGLEEALLDCEAALAQKPDAPDILDSKAFVEFRLGRHADAVRDYDAALKLRPTQGQSLFGRGLAKIALGQSQAGQADLAAARAAYQEVDEEFREYGVKAPAPPPSFAEIASIDRISFSAPKHVGQGA